MLRLEKTLRLQAQLDWLGPQQRNNLVLVTGDDLPMLGSPAGPDIDLEDLKQFRSVAVAGGRDDRIHAIAELHQADAAVVVH